jgi:outer membrane protein TolC
LARETRKRKIDFNALRPTDEFRDFLPSNFDFRISNLPTPMLIRRALALSAVAIATGFAGDKVLPPSAGAGTTQVLTLREAITMALKDNIDIQWHKTDIKLDDTQIRLAWGDFDPALSLDSTYSFTRTPQNPTTITSADTAEQILLEQEALAQIQAATAPTPVPLPSVGGATPAPAATIAPSTQPFIFQNEDFRNSLSFQGKSPLGTTYKLGVEADHLRDTVLNINEQFLPSDVFFAGLTIDQPLLQGFGYDANMASIRIGRRNRQIGYNNWHQRIIDSVGEVMATYFDMTYAQEVMRLRQESMDADRALAKGNQRRVDVGLMTPIDVRQAQVEVSADQDDLLTAQNVLIARVADLKKLIYRGVEQDDGRTFLTAGPVDLPAPVLDRDSLLEDAYRYRVDYATAIQQSEIENVRLKYYQNQLLPRIDFVGTFGVNGLSTDSSASSAFGGQAPQWSFSFQGSMPLGNVAARANMAASRRLKEEAIWKLKQVELSINTDVDTAISAIQTNQQRVDTSRQARKFAEEVVRMQNRRLEAGQASTLDILDGRRRLYDAQSRELGAVDDLNKSIVQLYLSTGTLLREQSITLVDDESDAPKHHHPVEAAEGNGGGRRTGEH